MYEELLRLANLLAADTGGFPRWVAHNRAVSTAYYALFHRIAELCARRLVGAWAPFAPFQHVYRSLDHGHALRVFEVIQKKKQSVQEIRDLAAIFTELQKARHAADYDPGYRVSGPELSDLLIRARLGIDLLNDVDPGELTLLAARLIGRTRG